MFKFGLVEKVVEVMLVSIDCRLAFYRLGCIEGFDERCRQTTDRVAIGLCSFGAQDLLPRQVGSLSGFSLR